MNRLGLAVRRHIKTGATAAIDPRKSNISHLSWLKTHSMNSLRNLLHAFCTETNLPREEGLVSLAAARPTVPAAICPRGPIPLTYFGG